MNTKPEISDEEIRSYMNFDSLLLRHAGAKTRQGMVTKGLIITILVLSGLLFTVTFNIDKREKPDATEIRKESITPSLLPDSAVYEEKTKEDSPNERNATRKHSARKNNLRQQSEQRSATPSTNPAKEVEKKDAPNPSVYVQAEPVEGYPALYEYFSRELRYPQAAMKDSLQGVVSVVFTIRKDGAPDNISIEQSLGTLFDEEAIRVIKNMPLWKPATYNGRPFNSRVSLPLTFQISKIKDGLK